MISTLDRAALRAEARAHLRPRPRPADAAGHRRLAGRPPAQPVRRRGRAGLRRGRRPGAARRRARRARPSRRDADRRSAVRRACRTSTGWTSPTPPPTPCVCRAGSNTVTEVAGVGLPAIFVPLPIGNGEQALNARPVVDAGGGLLVADAALTPEWVRGTVPALLTDPDRLAAMSAAAARRDPARRRREAGRPDRSAAAHGGAAPMRVPVPDELLPADQLGTRALRRHRRRRPVRHRPDHAGPRHHRHRQRRQGVAHARGAARARGHLLRRPRRRPTSATPTPSWSRPPCARTTPRSSRPPRRGLRLLPRSAALESVMQGRARRRGRRHPRQDHDHLAAHRRAAALRRRPVVRDRRRPQRDRLQRPRRQRRAVRRRGRRERRRLPGLLAVRRAGHQRRGRPPRQLRHRRRPTARPSTTFARPDLDPAGFLVVCADDPGADALRPHGGRARAAPSSAWGSAPTPTCAPRTLPLRAAPPPASRWSTAAAGSARSPCRSRAGTTSSTRSPRWPAACGSASRSPTCAAGSRRSAGTRRRMELKGEAGGVRVYDSYAHHPNEIAGDLQAARVAGGRGPGRGRLPAAPGLAHPDLRPRHGRGARRRRRGRRDGRLRRPRGPRARRHRRAWSPTRVPLPAEHVRLRAVLVARPPATSSSGPGPATWC